MSGKSEFYMYLPSNSGENNLTGNFTVHLAENIHLDGEWEVALTEIIYPYTWNNLPPLIEKDNFVSTAVYIKLRSGEVVYSFLEEGQYSTISDLLLAFTRCFRKRIDKFKRFTVIDNNNKDVGIETPNLHLMSEFVRLSPDKVTKRITLKIDKTQITGVSFSKRIGYMLGFESNFITVPDTEPISAKNKWYSVRGEYAPDLKVDGNVLYIYCDLLHPQIVGNTSASLLRIVHTGGEYGSTVEKTFHHKNYIPLIINNFSHIHIDIKAETGRYIKFTSGKSILTLHFRRRRMLLDY